MLLATELGIDKSIFIKPKTFHLTVLMLKLWNKERVDTALRIFKVSSISRTFLADELTSNETNVLLPLRELKQK